MYLQVHLPITVKKIMTIYGEEKKQLLQRDEVKSMGEWPAKDCVAVIDNIIVIKLGTEGD